MSVCIKAPKSPRLCYVCGKWCSLTSYHKNHPGMRSRCSGGHIGRFAAWTLAKVRSLAGWLLSWMNSFIAKSARELVICPSFDGKITSEPNKTGSLTTFSKLLDLVNGHRPKVHVEFNSLVLSWRHIVPIFWKGGFYIWARKTENYTQRSKNTRIWNIR